MVLHSPHTNPYHPLLFNSLVHKEILLQIATINVQSLVQVVRGN